MPEGKRSWPLILLAGCSLIPGFGFLLGAVAVTWGLVSDRPRARLAVIIGAAGALLNLLGGALLMRHLQEEPAYAAMSTAGARADLKRLVGAIESYHKETGRYPGQLTVFSELPYSLKLVNIQDFSGGVLRRPREYQYELAPDGLTYTLSGVGADRRPGTADDVYPELSDTEREHTGYRPGP